jgi:hypothetical protein
VWYCPWYYTYHYWMENIPSTRREQTTDEWGVFIQGTSRGSPRARASGW